jgi:drug/metabolite transporter (DMT)-like permease
VTQPKLDIQGLMAALCATATWGMSGIFVRWLPGWSPFLVLTGRFLVAIAVLLPILLLSPDIRSHLMRSLSTRLIWWLSLPAIGSYILGTAAFQMAPVGEVTLLFTTSPLFIVAYKAITHLPIKRSESVGILLAAVGVSLLLLPKLSIKQINDWQPIAGYILAFGAAGLVAHYTFWFSVLAKQGLAPKSIEVVFVTFLLGGLLSLLCSIIFSQLPVAIELSVEIEMSKQVILIVSELGILSTALPFLCYTVAAQRLPVMLSTALLMLEPMFAALFASIALQEVPSPWFGMGSLFICSGLLSIAQAGDE